MDLTLDIFNWAAWTMLIANSFILDAFFHKNKHLVLVNNNKSLCLVESRKIKLKRTYNIIMWHLKYDATASCVSFMSTKFLITF